MADQTKQETDDANWVQQHVPSTVKTAWLEAVYSLDGTLAFGFVTWMDCLRSMEKQQDTSQYQESGNLFGWTRRELFGAMCGDDIVNLGREVETV